MRVFVIGGSGLVGQNIVRWCRTRNHEVVFTYLSAEREEGVELDKTDFERTKSVIEAENPDLVVDTAAFHAVDDCERERGRAWSVNAQGTRNAAVAADSVDAHYVYISTDYVFDGELGQAPYDESRDVCPANYYARTKHAGEQAARIPDTWTVLRGSVVYGLANDNFLTWVLGELSDGEEVGIVDDQASTPTYAPDLARACVAVGEENVTGLFHAGGPDSLTRYEFTESLAEQMDFDASLVSPITTEELGQEARRPPDSSLDSRRLYAAIGYEFRSPETAFREIRDRWNERNDGY